MSLSTLEIGAEQFRSVTEIVPKSPFLSVNRWTDVLSDMVFVPAQKLSDILN